MKFNEGQNDTLENYKIFDVEIHKQNEAGKYTGITTFNDVKDIQNEVNFKYGTIFDGQSFKIIYSLKYKDMYSKIFDPVYKTIELEKPHDSCKTNNTVDSLMLHEYDNKLLTDMNETDEHNAILEKINTGFYNDTGAFNDGKTKWPYQHYVDKDGECSDLPVKVREQMCTKLDGVLDLFSLRNVWVGLHN